VPANHPVHVHVDEVQSGRRAKMPEQAGLGVLQLERLTQERVIAKVDLADRKIIGGPPVAVDRLQFILVQWAGHSDGGSVFPREGFWHEECSWRPRLISIVRHDFCSKSPEQREIVSCSQCKNTYLVLIFDVMTRAKAGLCPFAVHP